jgi:hypothetical protein
MIQYTFYFLTQDIYIDNVGKLTQLSNYIVLFIYWYTYKGNYLSLSNQIIDFNHNVK